MLGTNQESMTVFYHRAAPLLSEMGALLCELKVNPAQERCQPLLDTTKRLSEVAAPYPIPAFTEFTHLLHDSITGILEHNLSITPTTVSALCESQAILCEWHKAIVENDDGYSPPISEVMTSLCSIFEGSETKSPSPIVAAQSAPSDPDRFLSFRVGEGRWGIPLSLIQELVEIDTPLSVSCSHSVTSELSVKGEALDVVNLRAALGLGRSDSKRTILVVCKSEGPSRLALQVDRLCSINDMPPAPSSSFGISVALRGTVDAAGGEGPRNIFLTCLASLP
jgi:chemotaxis signal transduction protein